MPLAFAGGASRVTAPGLSVILLWPVVKWIDGGCGLQDLMIGKQDKSAQGKAAAKSVPE